MLTSLWINQAVINFHGRFLTTRGAKETLRPSGGHSNLIRLFIRDSVKTRYKQLKARYIPEISEMALKNEVLFLIRQNEVKQSLNCVFQAVQYGDKSSSLPAKRSISKSSKPTTSAAKKVAETKASRDKSPTKKKASASSDKNSAKKKAHARGKKNGSANGMPQSCRRRRVYTPENVGLLSLHHQLMFKHTVLPYAISLMVAMTGVPPEKVFVEPYPIIYHRSNLVPC
ncbi:hypothetical protein AVEN_71511-1 [Araneus ventricosus]|uniref:Uncharacterized protein n=1 Tax=Araneus ventricosus TaxID=182803 RepID=A0A4Y2FGF6_ARAVE|nr:hypothetical protein AVEN_71511-1 [Araneus ventricosus]